MPASQAASSVAREIGLVDPGVELAQMRRAEAEDRKRQCRGADLFRDVERAGHRPPGFRRGRSRHARLAGKVVRQKLV